MNDACLQGTGLLLLWEGHAIINPSYRNALHSASLPIDEWARPETLYSSKGIAVDNNRDDVARDGVGGGRSVAVDE